MKDETDRFELGHFLCNIFRFFMVSVEASKLAHIWYQMSVSNIHYLLCVLGN